MTMKKVLVLLKKLTLLIGKILNSIILISYGFIITVHYLVSKKQSQLLVFLNKKLRGENHFFSNLINN